MDLTLIAALSENNVIGINNKIPWRISDDMKHFQELTMGHPVIMGRKTADSIPEDYWPLEGRKNIVMSRADISERGIYLAKNMVEAIRLTNGNPAYIMGGGEIYTQFLPFVTKMELTRIHKNFEGDAFFPEIDWKEWNIINEEKKETKKGLSYSFLTYKRKL